MSAVMARRRFTVDQYHRLAAAGILAASERLELVDGEVIVMAPIGSLHAGLVTRLAEFFQTNAEGRFIVWCQNPVALPPDSEPEPDLALLKPRPDGYAVSLPTAQDVLLVVEVADTSLAYDREVKLPLYARHGIAEAWLLDAAARRLELHRDPGREGYRTRLRPDRDAAVSPLAFPTLQLDPGALFRGIG